MEREKAIVMGRHSSDGPGEMSRLLSAQFLEAKSGVSCYNGQIEEERVTGLLCRP